MSAICSRVVEITDYVTIEWRYLLTHRDTNVDEVHRTINRWRARYFSTRTRFCALFAFILNNLPTNRRRGMKMVSNEKENFYFQDSAFNCHHKKKLFKFEICRVENFNSFSRFSQKPKFSHTQTE